MKTCAVPDCTRPYYAKSYCAMHWRRWKKHGDPLVLGRSGTDPRPLAVRFWEHVNVGSPNECWEWKNTNGGYAGLWINERQATIPAHRVSFFLHYGVWPTFACHTCDNPPCVNPSHLFDGDPLANSQDMSAKGRWNNQHVNKTHCKWGHPLSGDNIHIDKHGTRHCRACQRRRREEWDERKRLARLT